MNLKGKTAVVTGGSRGIGKAIALGLAQKGADIALNYTERKESALEVQGEILALGVRCEIYQADVSREDSVKAFVEALQADFPRIDILVNNAGITRDGPVVRMSEEDFTRVLDINLKGTFLMSKYLGKLMMKQREGRIINIASVVGLMGNAYQANYAASKAGIIGLTKSLAKEFAPRNIRVNGVAPGFIKTEMTDRLPQKVKEEYTRAIPLGDYGSPEDVAGAVLFLASRYADYVTGQILVVDGGMLM
ncbi:MAG: beta-ketoacyl-ACP reductase [delta proteobacterium ML8_F1]|nr:MAG: beta-ketoacyl-ACP reductase [delta proteobacterium ML8_F1]